MDSGQIGGRIRAQRTRLQWTQQELADKARVNLMMINRYERGHILPSVENLIAIATALGVSIDYLAAGTDDPRGVVNESDLSPEELRVLRLFHQRDLPALLRVITDIADDSAQQRIGGEGKPVHDQGAGGQGKRGIPGEGE